MNIVSASILTLKKFQEKFNKYLQIFAINSALLNLNDFIMVFSSLVFNMYDMNFSYTKAVYNFVYYIIWSVLYTFGGFLDIFIVYERIQLINPNWSFLLNKKATRISIGVFILCIAINMPLNMSRRIDSKQFLVIFTSLFLYMLFMTCLHL